MANLNEWFTVHPRKRVERTPLTDWAGRPMPKTLSDVYGSYSSKKAAAKMTMMFDESCIPTKRAYVVRFHAMD